MQQDGLLPELIFQATNVTVIGLHSGECLHVSEPNSGQWERENGSCNVLCIHSVERFLGLPLKCRWGDPIPVFGEVDRGYEMMMNVDQGWL
jgi:hypothetical protein